MGIDDRYKILTDMIPLVELLLKKNDLHVKLYADKSVLYENFSADSDSLEFYFISKFDLAAYDKSVISEYVREFCASRYNMRTKLSFLLEDSFVGVSVVINQLFLLSL